MNKPSIVHTHPFAVAMILLATLFWGISFPIMKALGLEERILLTSASTEFAAMSSLTTRFFIATILLLPFCMRTLLQSTRKEIVYGSMVGVFIGFGAIAQIDGISYTSASTCGFLTATYVVIIPIIEAITHRKIPSLKVLLCVGIALLGIGILSGVNLKTFTLGRGELESLIGSCFFCGQILILSKVDSTREGWANLTFYMFLTVAIITGSLAMLTAKNPSDIIAMHNSPRAWTFILLLASLSTVAPFALMNRFQPALSATAASVIYCAEPIFVTLFALFLPELLMSDRGIYPNEHFTLSLLLGGGLITAANIVLQLPSNNPRKSPTE